MYRLIIRVSCGMVGVLRNGFYVAFNSLGHIATG